MKEIKIINQAEAVKNAFYSSRFTEIDLWLFGQVSLIGCYQENDNQHPFFYFWKIEDKAQKHQTVYIGVFEQEKSFTEHYCNRVIHPGDIIFWEEDIFAYHQSFNKLELITPFGLINPEKLRKAFPPNHPLSDSHGKLYRVVDESLKEIGYYWSFSARCTEKIFPVLPLVLPNIDEIKEPKLCGFSNTFFSSCSAKFYIDSPNLRVDISCFRARYLEQQMNDKLFSLSDNGKKWQITNGLSSFGNLSKEDIASIITDLNNLYGVDLQNDGSWKNPNQIILVLSDKIGKRIFV